MIVRKEGRADRQNKQTKWGRCMEEKKKKAERLKELRINGFKGKLGREKANLRQGRHEEMTKKGKGKSRWELGERNGETGKKKGHRIGWNEGTMHFTKGSR